MNGPDQSQRYSMADFAAQLEAALKENRELRDQLNGRVQSLFAVKEKLLQDDFERRLQDLTVAVRRERQQYTDALKQLKTQLGECICGTRRAGGKQR